LQSSQYVFFLQVIYLHLRGSGSDNPLAMLITKESKIYMVGKTTSSDGDTPPPNPNNFLWNGWFLEIDTLFKIKNSCRYSSSDVNDCFYSIAQGNNNDFYLAGNSYVPFDSVPYLYSQFWLIGLSSLSIAPEQVVKEDINIYIHDRNLMIRNAEDDHPIKYVKIYSGDGKLIAYHEGANSGTLEVILPILPGGIYLVEVFTDHMIVKKWILQE